MTAKTINIKVADRGTPSAEVPVYSYWEGPMPAWIGLCFETMRKYIPTLVILSKSDFADIVSGHDVPPNWKDQLPNVQSDFVRSFMLSTYGGFWIDADCIMFKDITPVWARLEVHDFVAYRVGQPNPQLCSALLASYPDGKIATRYHEIHCNKLEIQPDSPLHRLSLGPRTISNAAKQVGKAIYKIPTAHVHPIHWGRRRQFWTRQSDELHLKNHNFPNAYCCMLTHRSIGPLKAQTRKQIMSGETLISYLFRKAL